MSVRVGINGFGRMGRLAVRALRHQPGLQLVHVNEIKGGVEAAAHLLEFDTVHGRYTGDVAVDGDTMVVDGSRVSFSSHATPAAIDWAGLGVDLVIESSGKFKTAEDITPHLDRGAQRVVVACPVKSPGVLNVVMGCNDNLYDPAVHRIVTAASCTTNCLAPVVKVLHQQIGIERGAITTVHDVTNTQVIVDAPHKDLRRARSALNSLVPTSTGSATAITLIYPELTGKLNGTAVRVPLLNASLTDCVFTLARDVTVEEINGLLREAAAGELQGILGFEDRPLVSADYVNDTRSGIVDGPSTMVIDGRMVKVLVWYDNEYGYAHRMVELAAKVAGSIEANSLKLRNYILVTAGYWVFTVTDGALRMLVLLHFNELGYSPVAIAFLFLAYEFMGILTNLLGGWVGSRRGLNRTLVAGLGIQIVALAALTFESPTWQRWLSVSFVMAMQALSGIAKDLTKMSSKSAVKTVAGDGSLFRLVAILTGSKNALKGVGFFVGAALLSAIGYDGALWSMAAALAVTVVGLLVFLNEDIGKSKRKPPLRSVLSKSSAINRLSAARFFLFGSRDIWFVVALPVFLSGELGWSERGVGGFLAAWVIGYGIVQSFAPKFLAHGGREVDEVKATQQWALALAVVSAAIAALVALDVAVTTAIVGGLIVFGIVFAMNSSLHSFLVLAFSDDDEVALDVGFYYSANAAGRLVGTLLSGLLYLWGDLTAALWGSTAFVVLTWLFALRLPPMPDDVSVSLATIDAGD